MGSIADKLACTRAAKTAIRAAIVEKGGTLAESAPFSAYAAAVDTIPAGGLTGETQEKTILPSFEAVTVTPDGGYAALSAVVQPALTNLRPWNLRRGVTVLGVTGTADLE